jgi:hypothetical protein
MVALYGEVLLNAESLKLMHTACVHWPYDYTCTYGYMYVHGELHIERYIHAVVQIHSCCSADTFIL